jgi:hypothetical protein
MNRTQLNLDLIRLKYSQLHQEILQSGSSLNTHCEHVKSKIDWQADRLIEEINAMRENNHARVDSFNIETISSLDKNLPIFELNFRKLCAEVRQFESTCSEEVTEDTYERLLRLSESYLAKLETRQSSLNCIKFNNKLIICEPNMVKLEDTDVFGDLIFSQINQPVLQFNENDKLAQPSNHKTYEIAKQPSSKESMTQSMEQFDDGKFLFYSFDSVKGLRLVVYSRYLKSLTNSIKLIDLVEFKIAVSGQMVVLYYKNRNGDRKLLTMSNNLEIISKLNIESIIKTIIHLILILFS